MYSPRLPPMDGCMDAYIYIYITPFSIYVCNQAAFLQDCKDLSPAELKGKLETIMIQSRSFSTQSSFAADADYRSEAELLQDYPKDEVENIKKKALKFEHPTRGCIVYQDVVFKASREDYPPMHH